MAIVFAVRGTSLDARYSSGGKTGSQSNGEFSVSTDAGALSGSVILAANNANRKSLTWNGNYNTPNGRAISILSRIKPNYSGTPSASRPITTQLYVSNGRTGRIEIIHAITTGNITIIVTNESGSTALNTSFGNWSPTSGTWYDIVFTWDGTTAANSAKLYIDGTLLGQLTPSAALSASWTNTFWTSIELGDTLAGNVMTGTSIDEIVIWDSVIDPTSVALVSGTGSLNGASRTSLVDVASFDGLSYSNVGITNVLSTAQYTYAGVSYTGSYIGPTVGAVKINETYGVSQTGTYYAAERYSDPGVAFVASGTSYLFNATTLVGTFSGGGTSTDPGVSNVRLSTVYSINGATLTGTLNVPTAVSGTANTCDTNTIKETIRYVLNESNTTTASVPLSSNMSATVQTIMKVNPEKIIPQASLFPAITVFLDSKSMEQKSIAGNQVTGKRKATLTYKIVGMCWNDRTQDYKLDPADNDLEYLMENIELILRNYANLNGNCLWQFPTGVSYHSAGYDEQTHFRIGIMDLQVTAYY